jgi:hypothetical protein
MYADPNQNIFCQFWWKLVAELWIRIGFNPDPDPAFKLNPDS